MLGSLPPLAAAAFLVVVSLAAVGAAPVAARPKGPCVERGNTTQACVGSGVDGAQLCDAIEIESQFCVFADATACVPWSTKDDYAGWVFTCATTERLSERERETYCYRFCSDADFTERTSVPGGTTCSCSPAAPPPSASTALSVAAVAATLVATLSL